MEKSEYGKYAALMIYLIRCVLEDKKPRKERLEGAECDKLFIVARAHNLAAITAYALEAAGIKHEAFEQARDKAIRKNILLDTERKAVLAEMEAAGIWYMPLKGAFLHEWYPRLGMRQMADNDILFDRSRAEDVKKIFLGRGYRCKLYGMTNHDIYLKEPVYNFEMHSALFSKRFHDGRLYNYYKDVDKRLIKDEDSEYGRHFSPGDFYLYMLAYEYKHFSGSGTGIRSLVDTYVFLKRFEDRLDLEYIAKEAGKLGIREFEENNMCLALKLFRGGRLDAEEKKLLSYYVFSGTYGNLENSVKNNLKKNDGSRLKYIKKRLFPPADLLQLTAPWVKKSPLLLPAGWVYRIVYRTVKGRKRLLKEAEILLRK